MFRGRILTLTVVDLVLLVSSAIALDSSNTGCNMNPGSDLMNCLGDYASIPPQAAPSADAAAQAVYYCQIYQKLADCWARGLYCREWLPMQIEADKFCELANSTTSSSTLSTPTLTSSASLATSSPVSNSTGVANATTITSSEAQNSTSASSSTPLTPTPDPNVNLLNSVIAEASNVVTSIWNNDAGTDIPTVSNNLGTKTEPTWTYAGASATSGETSSSRKATGSASSSGYLTVISVAGKEVPSQVWCLFALASLAFVAL
ncbi:hypothetical protein T439DRAFT_52486 [Meredithblackwellia eburnea MCA 4105]